MVPFDGNKCTHFYTWSDEVPNKTWAIGSGCSIFYNTDVEENCNIHMERNYKLNTFKMVATRDIKKGEELLHAYKSL